MIGWLLAFALFVLAMGPRASTSKSAIKSEKQYEHEYEYAKSWRENGHAYSGKPLYDQWQQNMRTDHPTRDLYFEQLRRDYPHLSF